METIFSFELGIGYGDIKNTKNLSVPIETSISSQDPEQFVMEAVLALAEFAKDRLPEHSLYRSELMELANYPMVIVTVGESKNKYFFETDVLANEFAIQKAYTLGAILDEDGYAWGYDLNGRSVNIEVIGTK